MPPRRREARPCTETGRRVRELACAHPEVLAAGAPLSMYVGRDAVLLTLDLQFADGTPVERVAEVIAGIESTVRAEFPVIRAMFVEPRAGPRVRSG